MACSQHSDRTSVHLACCLDGNIGMLHLDSLTHNTSCLKHRLYWIIIKQKPSEKQTIQPIQNGTRHITSHIRLNHLQVFLLIIFIRSCKTSVLRKLQLFIYNGCAASTVCASDVLMSVASGVLDWHPLRTFIVRNQPILFLHFPFAHPSEREIAQFSDYYFLLCGSEIQTALTLAQFSLGMCACV